MKRVLPPLNSLRAFEAAARHRSIVGAADELNVSPGAASRHVHNLEEYVGTPLFRRTKNGLILTKVGIAFAATASDLFDTLHEATLRARNESSRSVVKLRVTPTVAIRWLMPRMASFYGAHPDIDVQMTTAYAPVDFDRDDADLGIRLGSGVWQGHEVIRVLDEELMPICVPNLRDQEVPQTPDDLGRNTLLHSTMRPNDWRDWCSVFAPNVDWSRALRLENSVMVYQAASLGMGIAVTHNAQFFGDELALGTFVAPFGPEQTVKTGQAYFVVRPMRKTLKGPVKALWDWFFQTLDERDA